MKLSTTLSCAIFCVASMMPTTALPIGDFNDDAVTKRDVPSSSLKDWWPHWNGVQEGTNAVISTNDGNYGGHITVSKDGFEDYVNEVVEKSIGGWIRIQFYVLDTDGDNWHKILQAIATALQKGSDEGKYVQISLRSQKPGNPLTDEEFAHAKSAIPQLVNSFKGFKNFVLDTMNEASQGGTIPDWFRQWNSELVQVARDSGFEGFIAIEDYAWAGGLLDTTGISLFSDEDGLQKIKNANGGNFDHLIGSVHVYSTKDQLLQELDTIHNAGLIPQIGEYGNYDNGYVPEAVSETLKYQGLVNYYGGVTLSWDDQYLNSDGGVDQRPGASHSGNPGTHCNGYNSGLC